MLKDLGLVCGFLGLLGCGAAPSDTVHAFLEATRDADLATLARVSTVGWPGEQVQPSDMLAWWVNRVSDSERSPFELEERQQRLTNARERRDARLRETGDEEDAELQRIQSRVERLRDELEREREEARKSVETWTAVDGFQGDVETCQVDVIVRSPSGDYYYDLTLKRYALSREPGSGPVPSRWIVTVIEATEG